MECKQLTKKAILPNTCHDYSVPLYWNELDPFLALASASCSSWFGCPTWSNNIQLKPFAGENTVKLKWIIFIIETSKQSHE